MEQWQELLERMFQRDLALPMEFVCSGLQLTDLPLTHAPEIALVGRSNVGKSSLMNFLAGRKQLARVSRTPGRTQTINLFSVAQGAFFLVDLPGYGYAESPFSTREHWQEGLQRYFEKRRTLFAVYFLVDIRRDITEEDKALSLWLQQLGIKVIGVQTKCDVLHKREWPARRAAQAVGLGLSAEQVISTSAQKQIGRQQLLQVTAGLLEEWSP